jgi:hypothetical protein
MATTRSSTTGPDAINERQIVLSLAQPVALRAPTDAGMRKVKDVEPLPERSRV